MGLIPQYQINNPMKKIDTLKMACFGCDSIDKLDLHPSNNFSLFVSNLPQSEIVKRSYLHWCNHGKWADTIDLDIDGIGIDSENPFDIYTHKGQLLGKITNVKEYIDILKKNNRLFYDANDIKVRFTGAYPDDFLQFLYNVPS